MKRFLKRQRESDLEAQLRRERPQPRAELMQRLTDRVAGESRRHRTPRARIAAVCVALAAMLALFGAFGGIGYAASAVKNVIVAAKTVVTASVQPKKSEPNSSQSNKNANKGDNKNDNKGDKQGEQGNNNDNKHGDDGDKPDDKEYGHKKKICHNPGPHQQTLEVSDNAVPAHLAHGDYLGECHRR